MDDEATFAAANVAVSAAAAVPEAFSAPAVAVPEGAFEATRAPTADSEAVDDDIEAVVVELSDVAATAPVITLTAAELVTDDELDVVATEDAIPVLSETTVVPMMDTAGWEVALDAAAVLVSFTLVPLLVTTLMGVVTMVLAAAVATPFTAVLVLVTVTVAVLTSVLLEL